jgi:two-component system, OmpR family, response regulator MprA
MTHILIVDDNPTIAELAKYALRLQGNFQISCAYSGEEALEFVQSFKPDLIILDDDLPNLKGSEVAKTLRSIGSNVPILMLTARLPEEQGEDREIRCLKFGCDDFLFKPIKPNLLNARVQALLRRKGELFQLDASSEILNYADMKIDLSAHTACRGSRRLELTLREYALLTLFLRHPQQVLERGLILDRVWGSDYEGGTNVIDVYVGYLRTKLEAQGERRLIQTVRGVGYVLREPGKG